MPGNDAPKRLIDRRLFVAGLGAAGIGVWTSACAGDAETDANGHADHDEQEVSPGEDLMREHGVLKRVLLIYDEAGRRIDAGKDLPQTLLLTAQTSSARLSRTITRSWKRTTCSLDSRRPPAHRSYKGPPLSAPSGTAADGSDSVSGHPTNIAGARIRRRAPHPAATVHADVRTARGTRGHRTSQTSDHRYSCNVWRVAALRVS